MKELFSKEKLGGVLLHSHGSYYKLNLKNTREPVNTCGKNRIYFIVCHIVGCDNNFALERADMLRTYTLLNIRSGGRNVSRVGGG